LNNEKTGYCFAMLVALEVTRIFYQLLPKDDKEKLENLDYFFLI
jgi:hypothetical protein